MDIEKKNYLAGNDNLKVHCYFHERYIFRFQGSKSTTMLLDMHEGYLKYVLVSILLYFPQNGVTAVETVTPFQ